DSITFINNGKIEFSSSKEEIFERYALVACNGETVTEEISKLFIGTKKSILGFEGLTNNVSKVKEVLGDVNVNEFLSQVLMNF
ncbi:MAG: hypothetical protein ACERKZ_21960, partial [Lachnotalea sp.]